MNSPHPAPSSRPKTCTSASARPKCSSGIDLLVQPKETVVIIGPSGSGKTTFLRCINHLEKIDRGAIYVGGQLIGYRKQGEHMVEDSERNIAAQRARIGMVFQRFNLFPHMTALENVIEAPVHVKKESKEQATRKALELLAKVGLSDKAEQLPEPAIGRPAAAGGNCPRPRDGPHAHAI